jgi:hypothetical protein
MQQVKAGEASTDDEDVDLLGLRRRGPVLGLIVERHAILPQRNRV